MFNTFFSTSGDSQVIIPKLKELGNSIPKLILYYFLEWIGSWDSQCDQKLMSYDLKQIDNQDLLHILGESNCGSVKSIVYRDFILQLEKYFRQLSEIIRVTKLDPESAKTILRDNNYELFDSYISLLFENPDKVRNDLTKNDIIELYQYLNKDYQNTLFYMQLNRENPL